MIQICLLAEAIVVEICSRFIVDRMVQLAEVGKAKPAASAKRSGAQSRLS
jgi:hypothetical protein